jgi:hypothetical protein
MSKLLNPKMLLASVGIVLTASTAGLGCWCRTPGPVLDQIESSNMVVVGRVASVSETKAELIAERVYKGIAKPGDKLEFVQGQFGDCRRGFRKEEIGAAYLLYLGESKEEGLHVASICGRTNPIPKAFADLAYLDRIDEVVGRTRLYGYFTTAKMTAPDLENLEIKITRANSKAVWSVKTNANGLFEVYGLPPGDYIIEPQTPDGWNIDSKYMFGIDNPSKSTRAYTVTVKAGRHTETRIRIYKTEIVSGYRHFQLVTNDPVEDSACSQ